ncbi:uncharacterized protein DS421_13g424310 [Arachis hypogaea]|nr:uncharacterized protein DS421_13g424310 [Arachis hypogaea]
MKEERGECVTEQGKLVRVRSVATVVAPCAASFAAPRHHHRRRTTMESLPSNRHCELLSSLKQNPMRRERDITTRGEREGVAGVSAAAALSAIAAAGVTR